MLESFLLKHFLVRLSLIKNERIYNVMYDFDSYTTNTFLSVYIVILTNLKVFYLGLHITLEYTTQEIIPYDI